MLYQFRFDILFLFAFIAFLFFNMTFGAASKSEVKTANAAVESQSNIGASGSVDNPVAKN